jgi:hypothetical protein
MQDFFDFLLWLGFTMISAAGFGFSSAIKAVELTGLEFMTLGLCTSIACGSAACLVFRCVGRRIAGMSSRMGRASPMSNASLFSYFKA